ncbi:mRNA-capping enzyme isoform X3 [Phyllobates terribilis]|uniref:mRNA-capping enzyme isoform X3 n=1 Tax=Phyllobates terribilis TaxID=111132 RepID=UPI003CCAB0CF
MAHNKIPPRWLNCPRRGQPVAGKFLPLKTMLGPKYDDQVPEENRFHPSMLSNYLKSLKVKMGLLVDLTNTTRFYDRNDIEKEGIKYIKLQCKGHGECPSKENTETFIRLCEKFADRSPDELIGVHCTHGFNRTGFLICAFLVEKMDWSIEAAVATFAHTRPPGIYKADYIRELFQRYGDVEDAPPPPELPEWCFEDDDVDDEGNGIGQEAEPGSSGTTLHRKKKERLKLGAIFLEGFAVKNVAQVTTQPKLGEIQRKCQQFSSWEGSGFPGAQPVSMDRNNIKFLEQKSYKVSWKADGTRQDGVQNGKIAARKPLLRTGNKQKRLVWAKEHKEWTLDQWKSVLWSDESQFEIFGSNHRVFVRRRKGERMDSTCLVPTVKHGGGGVMVWGCFAGDTVGDLLKIEGILNQHGYHSILQRHAIPSGLRLVGPSFIFQQDNDPKYTSRLCKGYLTWPPQSPYLNPIEMVWCELDRRVKAKGPTSAKHLWELLQDCWKTISGDYLLKLIKKMPRVCKAVIKAKGGYFEETRI